MIRRRRRPRPRTCRAARRPGAVLRVSRIRAPVPATSSTAARAARRDAAHAHQEVQRACARRRGSARAARARAATHVARADERRRPRGAPSNCDASGSSAAKTSRATRQAGQDERLPRGHDPAPRAARRPGRRAGVVTSPAVPQILVERRRDDAPTTAADRGAVMRPGGAEPRVARCSLEPALALGRARAASRRSFSTTSAGARSRNDGVGELARVRRRSRPRRFASSLLERARARPSKSSSPPSGQRDLARPAATAARREPDARRARRPAQRSRRAPAARRAAPARRRAARCCAGRRRAAGRSIAAARGRCWLSARRLRILTTSSCSSAISRSAAGSTRPARRLRPARDARAARAAPGSCCHSSSVTNGMNGCSSRSSASSTSSSTARARGAGAARRRRPRQSGLASSMYQSQNSCQTKWYSASAARRSGSCSSARVDLARASLQRATGSSGRRARAAAPSGAARRPSAACSSTKRDAFQSLLAKAR